MDAEKKFRELGIQAKKAERELSQLVICANIMGLNTRTISYLKRALCDITRFKSDAEKKMFETTANKDKNMFYGIDEHCRRKDFDPLMCECGAISEFCDCFRDIEDEA